MNQTVAAGAGTPQTDTFKFEAVDPAIKYPSYKCMDKFVDTARLRSLDVYLRQRIRRYIRDQHDVEFYTGPYTLRDGHAGRPGSRMIYLAESGQPDSYFDLDRTQYWHRTKAADDFSLLMDFIATLPFKATGRMLIMFDDQPREVPAHRDHTETEVLHEFIWFRTNFDKRFYLLNYLTGEQKEVSGHTAWFDTVNQFHGSPACEAELAFSVRVDGIFTDEFRALIPRPPFNVASTPSYWASLENE